MGLLSDIFSGGTSELVKSVGSVIDGLTTSKEEKEAAMLAITQEANRHKEALIKSANEIEQSYLADIQSSREANVKIQESDKASWLAKNVAYCIDIFFIITFVLMLIMIIFKTVPMENKELFYTSFGLLGSYVGSIINFHRGSSSGSHAKQKHMEAIIKKDVR